MPDRDFLHAKGVAAFAGYPAKSVYQEGNGFDAVPDMYVGREGARKRGRKGERE